MPLLDFSHSVVGYLRTSPPLPTSCLRRRRPQFSSLVPVVPAIVTTRSLCLWYAEWHYHFRMLAWTKWHWRRFTVVRICLMSDLLRQKLLWNMTAWWRHWTADLTTHTWFICCWSAAFCHIFCLLFYCRRRTETDHTRSPSPPADHNSLHDSFTDISCRPTDRPTLIAGGRWIPAVRAIPLNWIKCWDVFSRLLPRNAV